MSTVIAPAYCTQPGVDLWALATKIHTRGEQEAKKAWLARRPTWTALTLAQ